MSQPARPNAAALVPDGSRAPGALGVTIAAAKADRRAALIGYLPVGYPDVDTSIAAMRAIVAAGVDIVEVGVPYSDPGMDGPTIQAAVDPAVRAGVAMRDVLRAVTAVADAGAAAVVMTYWNPVERYGVTRFAADLADAGGSGAITPDLIPDEATPWIAASDAYGLDRVFLVAPSSTDARLASTAAACRGFVYAASTMGVTGARDTVGTTARTLVARVRAVSPELRGLRRARRLERAAGRGSRAVRRRRHRRLCARPLPAGLAGCCRHRRARAAHGRPGRRGTRRPPANRVRPPALPVSQLTSRTVVPSFDERT